MKLFLPLSVLVLLGLFTPNLLADPVLTINAGVAGGALAYTSLGGVDTWIYSDNTVTAGVIPPFVQTDSDLLTVIFSDVAGVALLNVTDVCLNTGVLAPANPCAGFAFSDTALGAPYLLPGATGDLANLDLAAAVDINLGVLGTDVAGLSLGNGTAQIGFGNPPSVTPEPPALTLLGTGLLGLAGLLKKRMFA